jgi:hypothetical protein
LIIAAAFSAGAQAGTAAAWAPTATKSYLSNHPATSGAMARQALELPSGAPVHIAVSLKLGNKSVLDALIANIRNGGTRYLTPAQFTAQFGPTQDSSGNLLMTTATLSNANAASGYQFYSHDLSA